MKHSQTSSGKNHAFFLKAFFVLPILLLLLLSGCSGRKQVLLVSGPYSSELFPPAVLEKELREYLHDDGYSFTIAQITQGELTELQSGDGELPAGVKNRISDLDRKDVLFFTPEFSGLTCGGNAYTFLEMQMTAEQHAAELPGRVLTLAAGPDMPDMQICAEFPDDLRTNEVMIMPVSKERVWKETAWELQRIANDRSLFFLYRSDDPEGERFRQTLEQILPKGAIVYIAFSQNASVTSQQIERRIAAEAENLGMSYQDISGKLLLVSDLGADNAASLQLAEQNGGKCIIEGASYLPHLSPFIYASLEIDPVIIIAESIRKTARPDEAAGGPDSTAITRGWSLEYYE